MGTSAHGIKSRPNVSVRPFGNPSDLGWIVMSHGEVYNKQFDWSTQIEIDTARLLVSFTDSQNPAREQCWIAEIDGKRIGCIMYVASEEHVDAARLHLLHVNPSSRGLGVGSSLVNECLGFARQAGYAKITLWTLDVLVSARKLYRSAGFKMDGVKAVHIFGKKMVGETWSHTL